ncbi:MAG: serine/threonine protein kinase [Myxococcales bacterium]|nr:serine/threonine protein kinase [Myxococcales bacterium]
MLSAGKTFGKYQVLRRLGQGGMGAVYEAEHVHLRKRVALKTLHGNAAEHPGAMERFLREGQAAAKVRHPHVVDVTDVGVEEGTLYLVMELLEGEDLAAKLAREHALAVADAIDLLLPVFAAVSAMHAVGLVHRDLKPENIFLAKTHGGAITPKVLDFGICRIENPDGTDAADPKKLSSTGGLVGTPYYMAPEQVVGARADARSDQHALGVILYECVVGARPYEAETLLDLLQRVAEGRFRSPNERGANLPPSLDHIIARALAPEPGKRFGSVTELAAALLPYASERGRAQWSTTFSATAETNASSSDPEADPAREAPTLFAPSPPTRSHTEPVLETMPGGDLRATLDATALPARKASRRPSALALASASVASLVVVALFVGISRRTEPPSAPPPVVQPVAPPRTTSTPVVDPRPVVSPTNSAEPPTQHETTAPPAIAARAANPPALRTPTQSTGRRSSTRSSATTATSAPPSDRAAPATSPHAASAHRPVINGAPIVD